MTMTSLWRVQTYESSEEMQATYLVIIVVIMWEVWIIDRRETRQSKQNQVRLGTWEAEGKVKCIIRSRVNFYLHYYPYAILWKT